MSGEFDVDEHIRRRRKGESFGIRYDPRTGSHVEFPLMRGEPVAAITAAVRPAEPAAPPMGEVVPAPPPEALDPIGGFVNGLARLVVAGVSARPQPFGFQNTVKFLRGGMSAINVRHRAHTREFFGCLAIFPATKVRTFLGALLDDGLLGVDWKELYGKTVPILEVPPDALPFLEGQRHPRLEALRKVVVPEDAGFTAEQARLFERLRAVRWTLAQEEGRAPFQIAADRVLDAMARQVPRDRPSLLTLRGIGKNFADTWGERFLGEINDSASSGETEQG